MSCQSIPGSSHGSTASRKHGISQQKSGVPVLLPDVLAGLLPVSGKHVGVATF